MKLYKVFSDNFDGEFMTQIAYDELTLQMSSRDYGDHKKSKLFVRNYDEIDFIDFDYQLSLQGFSGFVRVTPEGLEILDRGGK